ncbi:MAG: hypothetical protein JWQ41_2284 [Variovorax sp.]|nr:hypothetical protein [Variovorax sp.]
MKRLVVLFLSMALLAAAVFLVVREPAAVVASAGSPERIALESSAGSMLPPTLLPQTQNRADPSSRTSGTQTPAWLMPKSRAVATDPATPASTDGAGPSATIARLNVVMEKLNRLQGQPTIDVKEVGAAIAELEKINGSPVMSGVRLDLLRENLLVADQMQKAQEELQTIERAPAANASERAALIQSKTAELAALRSRIRHDVVQTPAGSVSP